MQRVLVIDKNRQPLMPCHSARARQMLRDGKAAVFRRYPFTIILKDREGGDTQPIAFKVDAGSKQTGLALVADFKRGKVLVWAAVLEHRGQLVKARLEQRRMVRRSRRARHTRYRQARFLNRHVDKGWLPPSLMSRVYNIKTWLNRLNKYSPIDSLSQELVKFDTALMQNAEINGVEYQQGELQGYEVREYLLEKYNRTCAYCGATNCKLEIEHINPKSRGGSDRVSNLTLACTSCNQAKDNKTALEFGYPEIQNQAKKSLKDAAAVNSTRWKLHETLKLTGLEVETGTGGRTKYNRTKQGYRKEHWIDAACIGTSGENVTLDINHKVLYIKATGYGNRQMCRTDKYGFPKQHRTRVKKHFGFQTGDMVKANIQKGKYKGIYIGKVTCRVTGDFDIKVSKRKITASHKYFTIIHNLDGYSYASIQSASK